MGAQGSVSRPKLATMRSLIKFIVTPKSMKATIMEKKLMRKTDRQTGRDEKRDTKV